MPGQFLDHDYSAGVYEISVAPGLPTRLYMAYRGLIYRSDDRGRKWTQTSFAPAPMFPNDEFRTYGQKMAVDPANPDVVLVGTPRNGLFQTSDGGSTWRQVAGIPASQTLPNDQHPGYSGIVFDPSSGTAEGKTKTVFVSSFGNGVFRSSDAGATWSALANGPLNISHAKIAGDGAYYASGDIATAVWRYSDGAWANITPSADTWQSVVTDPYNEKRIIAVRDGGFLDISNDRGATWSGIIWGPGYNVRVSPDIPWHAWTNETYMSVGDMQFDPVKKDRLWFAEGIGVWYTDMPNLAQAPSVVTFTSQSEGIEQLVANEIVVPPGGKPVLASWDRPVFYSEDTDKFPTQHGPDNEKAIVSGWALDYASSDPRFLAGIFEWGEEKSGYSANGGKTWTPFLTAPPLEKKFGGAIAVSTPNDIVWAASDNQPAYVTHDGGGTWSPVAIKGLPEKGESGWSFAHYLNRHIVAADRIMPGTFYLYNYLTGLYRSSDAGASWTLVHKGQILPWSGYNALLKSVPGKAGHLFFSCGPQSGAKPASSQLMRSLDGGVTWTPVPHVLEVYTFGFGKESKPGAYPAIFIVGWVENVYGVWRSDDDAASWVQIADYPLGSLDDIKTIDGDKNTFGKVYVGFGGSGYAYGVSQ